MSVSDVYIGLDVGSTVMKAALVNSAGEILEIEQDATPTDEADRLLEHALGFVARRKESAERQGWPIQALGMGVSGLVNPQTHRVERSPNLKILEQIDICTRVADLARLPVVYDNNANMAAYGELTCGAARGMKNMIYVTLGTGIGAGVIFESRIYRGSLGYAGEFGHTTVDPHGLECACGNIGCLETIASGPNIVRRAKERLFRDRSSSLSSLTAPGKGELTPERIAMEAINGDDFSLMVLERTGKWVGIAMANIVNLLNPDMVVLGGRVMVAGELLLRPIVQEVRRRAFGSVADHCRVVVSELGGQAGIIGAAMLARDTLRGMGGQ